VENAGGRVLTAAQVAAWCRAPETTKVTVKKVVDLNQHIVCSGYTPSDELAEHVRLRDRTCVFPYCTKPARICDLDHIVPHAQGGETSSRNLACLCRLHHRMKTHGGWNYAMVRPGVAARPVGHHRPHSTHGRATRPEARATTGPVGTPPRTRPDLANPDQRGPGRVTGTSVDRLGRRQPMAASK
jgi:5-methylcytosine-specific restriction endonuclease McrA